MTSIATSASSSAIRQSLTPRLARDACPFSPHLAERSPDLALLAAHIWRITSIDSPAYHRLFETNKGRQNSLLPDDTVPAGIEEHPIISIASEGSPVKNPRPAHAQTEGARLEQGMLSIFERLFWIDGGSWQAESSGTRRHRAQVRRQRSGTQYGADIVIRFKACSHRLLIYLPGGV